MDWIWIVASESVKKNIKNIPHCLLQLALICYNEFTFTDKLTI